MTQSPMSLLAFDLLSNGLLASQPSWWTKMWFRDAGSSFAPGVDGVFFFIFFTSAVSFAILMGLLVYWGVKYRRRPGVAPQPSPSHNLRLELAWSIIPSILMLVMFVWGMVVFLDMRVPPSGAEEIHVVAKKWSWEWEYPNGAGSLQSERIADVDAPVFAVPLNRPVRMVMQSVDVIHSFAIPEFRVKRDLFPNRYSTLWFEPVGQATHRFDTEQKKAVPIDASVSKGYFLFCTEYCGDQHSQMVGRIAVMSESDYEAWKDAQASTDGIDLVDLGQILYRAAGCNACHTVDGSASTGPTWRNVWGTTRQFTNGTSRTFDIEYLRQSILDPGSEVVAGYANQMPQFGGRFTPREIRALAVYIQSLSDAHRDAAMAESASERAEREAGQAGGGE